MPPTLQSATFKLKNGLHITTYGEYDADGNKSTESKRIALGKEIISTELSK